jgi:hypothetical protein
MNKEQIVDEVLKGDAQEEVEREAKIEVLKDLNYQDLNEEIGSFLFNQGKKLCIDEELEKEFQDELDKVGLNKEIKERL